MKRHAELVEEHRALLFSIAYEMLGSVMEAEDVLQETFVRWSDVDLDEVRSPRSYLARIASYLSLNRLRNRNREREDYPGPGLPEPLHEDAGVDPVVREEVITTAFLRVLETLTPMQRRRSSFATSSAPSTPRSGRPSRPRRPRRGRT